VHCFCSIGSFFFSGSAPADRHHFDNPVYSFQSPAGAAAAAAASGASASATAVAVGVGGLNNARIRNDLGVGGAKSNLTNVERAKLGAAAASEEEDGTLPSFYRVFLLSCCEVSYPTRTTNPHRVDKNGALLCVLPSSGGIWNFFKVSFLGEKRSYLLVVVIVATRGLLHLARFQTENANRLRAIPGAYGGSVASTAELCKNRDADLANPNLYNFNIYHTIDEEKVSKSVEHLYDEIKYKNRDPGSLIDSCLRQRSHFD